MMGDTPSRGGEIFMESKYTKNPETRKNMNANPMIVVFLPNFDESSMSSTWHVKWEYEYEV